MNPYHIRPPHPAEERPTGERCFIREIVNDQRVPEFSLAAARVEPGVTTERHSLDVDEWYVVRAGRGRMEVGERPGFEVGAGDTVVIPAGVAQRISNLGDVDLEFDCVCIPRFSADSYTSLE